MKSMEVFNAILVILFSPILIVLYAVVFGLSLIYQTIIFAWNSVITLIYGDEAIH